MKSSNKIILSNHEWADGQVRKDKDFFKNLSLGQSPHYLWIGCSDSRVSETLVTQSMPGEIFTHRNIANIASQEDTNFMSVLKYAVDYLKVKEVVVCGHYNCGGVQAAMDGLEEVYISDWISEIGELYRSKKDELKELEGQKRFDKMVELNVLNQVEKLSNNEVIKAAWDRGEEIKVHGWVYNLFTGKLENLIGITNPGIET